MGYHLIGLHTWRQAGEGVSGTGGRTDLARNIPLGRMGQAEEVAQAVAMVLGNSYMTGQTIILNGGMAFI